MSKKEKLSIDEIFYAIPKLRIYFKEREWRIRKYEKREKVESAVYEWRKEQEILLEAVQQMDIEDLRTLYYLQRLKKATSTQILKKIRNLTSEINNILED